MKKHFISVVGLSALGLGCNPTPAPTNPPRYLQPETYNPPPDTGPSTQLPSWESVAPPNKDAKAELILTPNGCYKNFVAADAEPKDRYEEKADPAKLGTLIECPKRAKELTTDPAKTPK